jgi:hypothetical protein
MCHSGLEQNRARLLSEPLSGRRSPMLALRAFLERKNQDRLHTLKGERREERDVVNTSRGEAKIIYLPWGPEMLKSSPILRSVYSRVNESLRNTLSKYKTINKRGNTA